MEIVEKYCEKNINVNINWHDLLEEYKDVIIMFDNSLSKQLDKLLNKIKNLSWIDKPPNETTQDITSNKQIEYIIELFMSYEFDKNKQIGVLLMKPNKDNKLSTNRFTQYKYKEYKQIVNNICLIGEIFGYKCLIVNNVDELNTFDYIIPISSLLLTSEEVNKIDTNKIIYSDNIYDYNICDKTKINFINFIHLVDNFIKHDDKTIYEYNYIVYSL